MDPVSPPIHTPALGYGLRGFAATIQALCAYVFMPIMVVVDCLDVCARYFFGWALEWAPDLITLSLLMVSVLAIPCATVHRAHVRVESGYERFPPRMKAWADALAYVCGLLFFCFLGYRGLADVQGMYQRGDGAEYIDIPYWPISLIAGISAVFVMLFCIAQIIRAVRRATAS